jgi:hypothetical protein
MGLEKLKFCCSNLDCHILNKLLAVCKLYGLNIGFISKTDINYLVALSIDIWKNRRGQSIHFLIYMRLPHKRT